MSVHAEEECYRVRVCLERFFSDERTRCFMSVTGARPVRWLRRRVRRLFGLPRHISLLCQGHLLPLDEPLSLLRPDDEIQVIPTTISFIDRVDGLCPDADSSKILSPQTQDTPLKNLVDDSYENSFEVIHTISQDFKWKSCSGTQGSESAENNIFQTVVNESSNLDQLKEVKEQALALLDSCTAPPPRRRRRVRRRRPRLPPSDTFTNSESRTHHSELSPEAESEHALRNLELVTKASQPGNTIEGPIKTQEKTDSIAEFQSGPENVPVNPNQNTSFSSDLRLDSVPDADSNVLLASTSILDQVTAASDWGIFNAPNVPSVVRNEFAAPRIPRVIHPLSNVVNS